MRANTLTGVAEARRPRGAVPPVCSTCYNSVHLRIASGRPVRLRNMDTRSSLLVRVRDRGDAVSWHEFVAIYEPLIFSYARGRVSDESAARDIVQDVFVALLKALPDFKFDRSRGRFRTWLWRVTHNAVVDRQRHNLRRLKAEAVWADDRDPAAELAEWSKAVHERVMKYALEKVAKTTRPDAWACFERHVLGRRPAAEVAAEIGHLSVNAVYINSSRVLDRLRKECLDAMMEDPDDDSGDLRV